MGTYDDLFSGDAYTRIALHRADVFVRWGEVDWMWCAA